MYFLAHMYSILKALPEEYPQELLEPLIVGSWSPDGGYFPHFSWKMRVFSHTALPPVNFYKNNKAKAFVIGWKTHIACDRLIHEKPFNSNEEPLCSPIQTNAGVWRYLVSSRKHLGNEVGLDLLIYENLLNEKEWIMNTISDRTTFLGPKIKFQGFRLLQKYIHQYTNWFLPIMTNEILGSGIIKEVINYKIYLKENFTEKVTTLLKEAQIICKKIVLEGISSQK
ncbi:MAG: zinc dependent phospholipase C family protein [Candidatus Heimdallarchaeota archaeon]